MPLFLYSLFIFLYVYILNKTSINSSTYLYRFQYLLHLLDLERLVTMHASIFKLYYTISGGRLKMYLRNLHYYINQINFCLSATEIQTHKKGPKAENHSMIAVKKLRWARGPFLLSCKDLNAVCVFTLIQEFSEMPVAGSKENIPGRQN